MINRKTSPAGIALIKGFEGCKLVAYRCPAGIWTIGYGHTGAGVVQGLVIDQARADQLLAADLICAETQVSGAVLVRLTQAQFDACVSFCYNTGPGEPGHKSGFVWLKDRDAAGNPQHSTMLRKLNAGDIGGAGAEFPKWNHGGEGVLAGLTLRREAEQNIFMAGKC